MTIGRRFLGVSEKLTRTGIIIPDGKGGHVTLSLPVRNRDKHVWYSWGEVKKRLRAVHGAHGLAKKGSSSRSSPTRCDKEAFQDFVGATPTREFVNSAA